MKNITNIVLVVLIGIFAIYFFTRTSGTRVDNRMEDKVEKEDLVEGDVLDLTKEEIKTETIIGTSVEGREITAYHYGVGEKEILFVGGIHGGYSWNTTLVAYELMGYLKENEEGLPEGVRVTVIPVLNPDGLEMVTGTTLKFSKSEVSSSVDTRIAGRFNENEVDLSRNFDCNWKEEGVWKTRSVSGGSKAFSEPESLAIRDYVESSSPVAVVVYYSAAGGVYASECNEGVLPETAMITDVYADASGYKAYQSFDFYNTTGDMVNWLAKIEIPAISVLLTTHEDVEWDKNRKGAEALIEYYSK